MDYYYNDDHDEDDLPEVPLSMTHYTRQLSNDNDDELNNNNNNNPSDKSIENWRTLYETSIHSLQSDDDDQKSIAQKPFYLDRPPSIEQPPNERSYSPIDEPQLDSIITKSKWEIHLPELLNSTVGPDRQKRDPSRRHTTDIVFQQSAPQTKDLNLHPSENDGNQPSTRFVTQLKQKFDRMTTNADTGNHSQLSSTSSKFHRVGSLTSRGLTSNTGERLIRKPRPALPIRPSPEITTVRLRSDSNGSLNNRIPITNNRNHRDKSGPPISYPKHYYPPPSTASVVKQLINGGATLVYDSISQKSVSKTKPSLIKHQRNLEQTREDLKNTNSPLTGRQLLPDHAKVNQKTNNHETFETDENYYEHIPDRTSYNSLRRKSIESLNYRTNDRDYDYSVSDLNIKK